MDNVTKESTLTQADEWLAAAENEMCKPKEDVVDYLICNNAYKAVKCYLVSYLMAHGVTDIDREATHTKELLAKCREVDPKFNGLDLSQLDNKAKGADIFMDLNTAKAFLGLAKQTRALVK